MVMGVGAEQEEAARSTPAHLEENAWVMPPAGYLRGLPQEALHSALVSVVGEEEATAEAAGRFRTSGSRHRSGLKPSGPGSSVTHACFRLLDAMDQDSPGGVVYRRRGLWLVL